MWFAVALIAVGSHGPAAGPAFAGIAARPPFDEERIAGLALMLGQALEEDGYTDLGSSPTQADVTPRDPEVQAQVTRGRALYLEGNFAAALEELDAALRRFEAEAAFSPGPSWSDLEEALILRSLALGRLGRDDDARAALVRLAALGTDRALDPEIAPPRVQARYAALRAELERGPRVTLQVTSEPAGAAVTVDGRAVGTTGASSQDSAEGVSRDGVHDGDHDGAHKSAGHGAPLTVDDLFPGTHHIGLTLDGERAGRTVTIASGVERVHVSIGDPRMARARALRARIAGPVALEPLGRAAAAVHDDVVVGVVVQAPPGDVLVIASVKDARVRLLGVPLPAEADAARVVRSIRSALRTGREGWLTDAGDVALPPLEALLSGEAVEPAGPGGWVWAAVTAGVVATAGAIAGLLLVFTPPTLEVVVDASRL